MAGPSNERMNTSIGGASMANEISHPRELAVLVVRRVGVVSVIVPAGPSEAGRKEGRKERSVLFSVERREEGGCKTRKQDGDRMLAFSLYPPPPLYEFSAWCNGGNAVFRMAVERST